MKTERFVIKDYDWAITILFNCDCNDAQEVVNHLDSIDCPYELLDEAMYKLSKCRLNTGLTYSNYYLRRTVMVINKTDSIQQTINSITHECYHFVCNLKEACFINNEEELATITGNFNMNCIDILRQYIVNKN